MASTCSNCKATLSCSCKLKKASNGRQCCLYCLSKYEQSLKPKK